MDLVAAPLRVTSLAKVSTARHKVRRITLPLVGADAADRVELLVSEGLTNALLHGHGTATVAVSCQGQGVRVEVRDDGPALKVVGRVDHGRGLTLVGALASRWGLDRADTGTCFWFEVDREVGQ